VSINYSTVMSINPYKNIIYVVNSASNTVSVIDGSADKVNKQSGYSGIYK
jgi:DNA-binding beta-propeller fold protein YncE